MTAFASGGQVMCMAGGRMDVRIRGELPPIRPEDPGRLLFVGDRVSLCTQGPEKVPRDAARVSGPVCLSPSKSAVIISTRSQRSMLPRDRFPAVAFGEEISCIFVEVPSDTPDGDILPAAKGGIAP